MQLLAVIRGGGDLATGVAWRLSQTGVAVVVTELAAPLTVRRTVSLSQAVHDGETTVEGLTGRLADDAESAAALALADPFGTVGVVVSPDLPAIGAGIVVDARLAKRNIDTTMADAKLVIGLGPGFTAGFDCHGVVETKRGHRLGRLLWSGSAEANTGVPGMVGGRGAERVLRAPASGQVNWSVAIGDSVRAGDVIGAVGQQPVGATIDGMVRGLVTDGLDVAEGLKIGDIDPRLDEAACHQISDKALAVGGGVAEAVGQLRRNQR